VKLWKWNFRQSPAAMMVIGGVATLVLVLGVVGLLGLTGGTKHVTNNAAVIGALVALGGVFTAQMVSIALEAQRSHEAALQNYLEQVGKLLIEKPLHRASPGDYLSTVVRAQTLSVLEGLDPERKRILLLFLYESGLIYKRKPVVSLGAANLRKADLSWTGLMGADLSGAFLNEANLSHADLRDAHLFKAHLFKADLSGAFLNGANLREANLFRANLFRANLFRANLFWANLIEASLIETSLREANVLGASLSTANLRESIGWTEEQWTSAGNLRDATMPDGQKYEDWLKSKGLEEDGENSGPS
jgi:uncharacterized protein YjbI with pentapeptide repeats